MGDVTVKRLQQSVFELAASANRNEGSGAGSGMRPLHVLADVVTTDTSVNIATANSTTYSSISGTSASFHLSREVDVLFIATCAGKCTAGGGGVFAYSKVHIDGTPYGFTQGGTTGIFDSNCVGYIPNLLSFQVGGLGVGAHTADVRIATDNNTTHWLQYATRLTLYQLGY